MVVPQQALLKQAGVQVLAFEANSLRALTQRVQQTAAVLGPDAQQKALAYQRYFDRNVALVTGRLKDLPASQRVSLYHSMGNPLTTTGRPSLNQDWIDLSGGQKQLVGLAQSLIRRPALLLLDEPLSALDLNYQFHVMDVVSRETRRRNMVTLVVLHDINIALRHAAQVIMLKEGKLIDSGDPQTVIHAESLAQVYGVRGRVERCAQGRSMVIVDGAIEK